MGSPPLLILIFLLSLFATVQLGHSDSGGRTLPSAVFPNFTTSAIYRADDAGSFLISPDGAFIAGIIDTAGITDSGLRDTPFYFVVRHAASNVIIWTANRYSPISIYGRLHLTASGVSVADGGGGLVWSTPLLRSRVAQLRLLNSGNLVLLDSSNSSLWQSFEYPTDTILVGQKLLVGQSLVGSVSDGNMTGGDYWFTVTGDGDGVLQWDGLTYWTLLTEVNAYLESRATASYMAINGSGLYIFGGNGSIVVALVALSASSDLRLAKIKTNGQFAVETFNGQTWIQEFAGPNDVCQIPFTCTKIEICSNGSSCLCPLDFFTDSQTNRGCVPRYDFYSLPLACSESTNGSKLNSSILYMKLPNGVDYFTNNYVKPVIKGVGLSTCEDLCSQNCSCLGIFHSNSTGSCYFLKSPLGSFTGNSAISYEDRIGYIKVQQESSTNPNGENEKRRLVGVILVSLFGFIVLTILVLFLYKKKGSSKKVIGKTGSISSSSDELDMISIPGLPVRFDYKELVNATDNFCTEVGSGGFGIVYKGTLSNSSIVAVKKITSSGIQGKREFCTEISIIGKVHHLNLVKLKGFCSQKGECFLVYEYMNKGSLDRLLFSDGPILEWPERFKIALGTARGLAYLHNGCEHKIIHCDVKPENILLHDNFQVKISDFGISKLLSREESNYHTTMRGTIGYLAPEWLHNYAMSDKLDVYSYGMVLLEIVRGSRNWAPTKSYDTENESDHVNGPLSGVDLRLTYFPLLALQLHTKGRYVELADRRLERRVNDKEVEKLVKVALCCVHQDPKLRPSMNKVVRMLEGTMPLCEPRMESLIFLQLYGRRLTEESRMGYWRDNRQNVQSLRTDGIISYISSQQVSGPR